MMNDNNSVARQVHVELEAVGASSKSAIEGNQRIFRSELASAAMGEDKRAVRRERRMHEESLVVIG